MMILLLASCLWANGQSTITYFDEYGIPVGKATIKKDISPYQPKFEDPGYVSSTPLQTINNVLKYKQELYNQRVQELQARINSLNKTNALLFIEDYPSSYNYYNKQIKELVDWANTVDLSINEKYYEVVSVCDVVEDNIKTTYKEEISNANKE